MRESALEFHNKKAQKGLDERKTGYGTVVSNVKSSFTEKYS